MNKILSRVVVRRHTATKVELRPMATPISRLVTYGVAAGGLFLYKLIQQLVDDNRHESFLHSTLAVNGLCAELDASCIGYIPESNSFVDSNLTKENQERIIAYCDRLKTLLFARYGDEREWRIQPVCGMPNSTVYDDLFTVFAIRSVDESPLMEYIVKHITMFQDYAKDDKIVLVNVAALVDDVNALKDIYEYKHLGFSGDYAQIYKYLRATTMSPSQLESLTALNMKLNDFYTENYTKTALVVSPLIIGLPLLFNLASPILNAFTLVSVIGCCLADSFVYGRYEDQKRALVIDYLTQLSDSELTPMLTHLYRLQDHYGRAKVVKCVTNRRLLDNSDGLWGSIESDIYERQLTEPKSAELVDQLLETVLKMSETRKVNVDVDPYEIYKDDEGYDYVFVG